MGNINPKLNSTNRGLWVYVGFVLLVHWDVCKFDQILSNLNHHSLLSLSGFSLYCLNSLIIFLSSNLFM